MRRKHSSSGLLLCALVLVVAVFGTLSYLIYQSIQNPQLPPVAAHSIPIHDKPSANHDSPDEKSTTLNAPTNKSNTLLSLEGAILDENEMTFPKAHISIKPLQYNDLHIQPRTPDEFGRFHFELPTGQYIAYASSPIAIAAATRQIDIEIDNAYPLIIHLARSRFISGTVVNEDSQAIAGAHIALYAIHDENQIRVKPTETTNAALHYSSITDASGSFSFQRIWPGAYRLEALAEGYSPHLNSNVVANDAQRTIILRTNSQITTNVIDQNGNPVFMAKVQLKRIGGEGILSLNTDTAQDGRCRFDELPLGRYQIAAEAKDYENTDKSETMIDLKFDAQQCTLALNHKGYVISGWVLEKDSEEPIPDFTVDLIVNESYFRDTIASTTTDKYGGFIFKNIHRGNYQVGDAYTSENDDSLYGLPANYRENIRIDERDVDNVKLYVFTKGAMSGHVYDSDKKPVASAGVMCDWGQKKLLTREDGSYRVILRYMSEDGHPWKTKATAFHPDLGYGESQEFLIEPGKDYKNIDVILKTGLVIYGKVTDKAGAVIPSATLVYWNLYLDKANRIKEVPLDSSGAYTLNNAPSDWASLEANAPDYVKIYRHIRPEKGARKIKEDFILVREDDNDDQQIAGIVVDQNGVPMKDVHISCNIRKITPEGTSLSTRSDTTDNDGRFRITGLEAGGFHELKAMMTKSPYLTKEIYAVHVGTQDIVIRLDNEPTSVYLSLDFSNVQHLQEEEQRILAFIQSNSNYKSRPTMKMYKNSSELMNNPIIINAKGDYTIFLDGAPKDKTASSHFFGTAPLKIDQNCSRTVYLNIPLEEETYQEFFFAIGQCKYPDGQPLEEQFRVFCRLLDPQYNYSYSANSNHDKKYPAYFGIPIRRDGNYEFVFMNMLDKVIDRKIILLSRDMAKLFEEEAYAVRIPDTVFPRPANIDVK